MTDADDSSDRSTDADEAETTPQPIVETTDVPATDSRPPATQAGSRLGDIDRRSAGIGLAAAAVLALVFAAGTAVGTGDDAHRGSLAAMRASGGAVGPGTQAGPGARGVPGGPRGGGMQGGRSGAQGGRGGMRGGRGEGMHGGRAGGPGRGMGIVTSASDDELQVEPLRGGEDAAYTVKVDDDTKVFTRGDAGPRDLEEADVDDIDEGDIVLVRGGHHDDAGDEADAAKAIMIVRAADE